MPSRGTIFTAFVALGAFVGSTFAQADNPDSVQGCYDNHGTTYNGQSATYQSQGACHDQCLAANKAVWAATKGAFCFCGDTLPEKGKVDMSQCNVGCQGYGQQSCGGDTTWLFGYTGALPPDVASSSDPENSSSKSSSSSKPTSSSTKSSPPQQTTIVVEKGPATVTALSNSKNGSTAQTESKSTTSKAGIAASAVVGVVAIIGIALGAFLIVRRNRRHRAEEEYQAAVAAKEFTASIRKPVPDARLDPVMLQRRRLSDGSIADNQDFSRRILKVANPDN